ncbi:MAG: hypothetical protein MJ246_05240 [Clostridia bacterium]|nr:hypothetical protein [Clostridia bacterium]
MESEYAQIDIIKAIQNFTVITPTSMTYSLANDYLPDSNPKGAFYDLSLDSFGTNPDRPIYDDVEIFFQNKGQNIASPLTVTFRFEGEVVGVEE